jgi:SAM-dependent methyltransferase
LADYEEIILACYLNGRKKTYLGRHGPHDLADWQEHLRPSFAPRQVRARRLGDKPQREYLQTIHRWLADGLAKANFDAPTPFINRSPDISIYQYSRLSADLAELVPDLLLDQHGGSYSTYMLLDGSLVHSSDFYRSIANFAMAVDGIETVLDVGCGSGFLACHLAASDRYKDVLGVDSSPYRVSGARLHAELNNCPARFEVMSVSDLQLPDRSVDMSITSFALEQTGEHLARCFSEIRRVTRKLIVLVEPANEFFPTLPSLWHVPISGWANQYYAMLTGSGLSFAVRPNLLCNYYNPGAVFIIDVERKDHPRFNYPQLFEPGVEGWPGGVTII